MEISSSNSSNRPRMTYDVFLSFRGGDTRKTFADFLYEALHQLGIMTFMDDKKLEIGDKRQRLFKAIKESRSSVVVLSKDYASSKWCLRELTKIIDCMGQTYRVLPVFYHVDPSDVRHQFDTFEESFNDHQKTAQSFTDKQREARLEEVQSWRDAMAKVGNLIGPVVSKDSSEVDIVKIIVKQIFNTWRPKLVASDENLVRMEAPLQHMNERLGVGLDDVRFVGIVGAGGIGKTTIAKAVYHCITPEFTGSCFLRITKQSNIVFLQQELLSRILLKEDIRIWDEDFGAEMIKKLLCGRKVLLVLDGVDEKGQLEMLAGSPDWFGPGSRVILTTRNRDSLKLCNKAKIVEYHAELLDAESAQRLFCKQAFGLGVDYPDRNFVDLCDKIIKKLNRLPLALKVIGSYLFEKNQKIWEETSERFLKVDEKYFFDILKISYDGLGAESQNVFLDLACFFNGKRRDRVIQILDSFNYSPHSEMQLLIDRCLIEVLDERIFMHDLIQEMGQEIVHRESLTHPGKQSRIWLRKDVNYVFSVKDGLKYTQGIVLNMEEQEELMLEAKSFTDMKSLKILQISNVHLSEDIKSLSNILGLLNWPGFPSKCLPSNFQSPYLFELHLPRSSLQLLWNGKKRFDELKVIDVSDSEYLLETPDFSKVPKLERLVLCNCRNLCHIHPSINCLDHLIFLDLKDCSSFRRFSSNMRCKSLETLILSGSGLTSFPEIEVNMKHLTRLYINQTLIKELHSSIGYLAALVVLDLSECTMLSSLPNEIGNLRSLETLFLNGCKSLDKIPPSLGNVELLQYLDICETSISQAPSAIHCLKSLTQLRCEKLSSSFWHSLLPPYSSPRSNSIVFGLKLFSYSFGLESLKNLSLRGCNLMDEDIPKDLHCFSALNRLDLSENNFWQLPESINHLKSLRVLILDGCTQLQRLPKLPETLVILASDSESQMRINKLRKHHQHAMDRKCILEKRSKSRRFIEMSVSKGNQFHVDYSFELFELFDEIKDGNQIEIQHDDSSHVYGVALLVYMQCFQNPDPENSVPLACDIMVDMESVINPKKIRVLGAYTFKQRTKVSVLYIPFGMLPLFYLPTQNSFCLKATIQSPVQFIKVEKCGAFVLSQKNAPEFLTKLFTQLYGDQKEIYEISRGSNHMSECSSKELENAVDYCSYPTAESIENAKSSESDSNSLLKRSLKSNLQRTLEEVKYDSPFHFFPLGEISGWFRIQLPGDTVKIKLPQHVHKKKKWMGLACFAIFSLRERFERISSPSKYSFIYQIESDEDPLLQDIIAPPILIPLHLFNGSHQTLFVMFIPRHWFRYELNEMDHLCIRFITNAAFVEVELCGAHLVYQENVEGLIHTIVDCSLKSGEDLYEFYNRITLKYLLNNFHLQMQYIRYVYKSVGKIPIDQPTTTPTSSEKSIQVQEQYGSKFDVVLQGNKIPEFFTHQGIGNEGAIRLPERMDCVGFLGCALVNINDGTFKDDTIRKPEICLRVLDLICQFEVDSHEVTPIHPYFVSEEKLFGQYTPQFIWFFYTPVAAFDVLWRFCNDFKIKLNTSNEELFHVQQWGLHLVCKREMKMIDSFLSSQLQHQQP